MELLTVTPKEGKYYLWLFSIGLKETQCIMLHSKHQSDDYKQKDWVGNPTNWSVFHMPYIWPSKYWNMKRGR